MKTNNIFFLRGDTAVLLIEHKGKPYEVLIDAEDLQRVLLYRWHIGVCTFKSYVMANGPDGSTIYLHRYVTCAMDEEEVDHVDNQWFDNRKSQLRRCTHSSNQQNRKTMRSNTVGYKGVHKKKNRFIARIQADGQRHELGSYKTAEEAARAYNVAAVRLHGEFASLNVLPETE